MALAMDFRLPVTGWPKATFETSYGFDGGRLMFEGQAVLQVPDRVALERGVAGALPGTSTSLEVRLDGRDVLLSVGGVEAVREDDLSAPPSRSAWIHAFMALGASFFGFVAGYLYLEAARVTADPWPMKMAMHMAGWHLLLTFLLFPASVWGQRFGIRAVQFVSFVFFAIHAGIAIANIVDPDPTRPDSMAIALFNALSGVLFGVATVYGNRAHADMDPVKALERFSESRG